MMTYPSRLLAMFAVALSLPVFTVALGQDAKVAAPAQEAKAVIIERVIVGVQDKAVQVEKKVDAKAGAAEKKKQDAADEKKKEEGGAVRKEAVTIKVQGRAAVKAIRVAAPMQVANVAAGDLDPMAAQFLPQFVPLMRTEMHFLLTVTESTPEQRKALVADRQKATKEAAKQYAASQQRQGRFLNSNVYPEPRKLAQDCLVEIAKKHLSAEKVAKYQAEIDRRTEDQKQLAIKNIVAKMDQDLVLTDEQREKISGSLSKNWSPAWCQSLETFMYGDQYFPAIPDNVVTPHLNPKQAQVWRATPRNGGVIFGGFNNVLGQLEANDVFPKDEEPDEKDLEKINGANLVPGQQVFAVDVIAAEVVNQAEPAKEEAKKDEAKKDGDAKKGEVKKDGDAKKGEVKKDETKKEDVKKEEAKKEDVKPVKETTVEGKPIPKS